MTLQSMWTGLQRNSLHDIVQAVKGRTSVSFEADSFLKIAQAASWFEVVVKVQLMQKGPKGMQCLCDKQKAREPNTFD